MVRGGHVPGGVILIGGSISGPDPSMRAGIIFQRTPQTDGTTERYRGRN